MKIWDLEAATKPCGKPGSLPFKTIPAPPSYQDRFRAAFVLADEYQVAVVIQFDRVCDMLYVRDFTGRLRKTSVSPQTKRKRNWDAI